MQLRPYQEQLVESVWENLLAAKTNVPCAVAPTGAGKTVMMRSLCEKVVGHKGKVLLLAHRNELVIQNENALDSLKTSIYSAGLGEKDLSGDVVVASRASLGRGYQKKLKNYTCNVVIIDECHRIDIEEKGSYRAMFNYLKEKNPGLRIVGFTATPFRLTGTINQSIIKTEDVDSKLFTDLVGNPAICDLIESGYLCPLISTASSESIDTSSIKIDSKTKDFEMSDAALVFSSKVSQTCTAMLEKIKGRKKCIIFCCNVAHARAVREHLKNSGENAVCIVGSTGHTERAIEIEKFREGDTRFLVGCDIFTEGFDAPNIDCVTLFRCTYSAALFAQMCGRGLRISPGKENCLVLDFGGNIERHGPLDQIYIAKDKIISPDGDICPDCGSFVPEGANWCSGCNKVAVKKREPTLSEGLQESSSTRSILGGKEVDLSVKINTVTAYKHTSKKGHLSLKIIFSTDGGILPEPIRNTEVFLNFNHPNDWVRGLARDWWIKNINDKPPTNTEEAYKTINECANKIPRCVDIYWSINKDGYRKGELYPVAGCQRGVVVNGRKGTKESVETLVSPTDEQLENIKVDKKYQTIMELFPGSVIEGIVKKAG